MFALALILAAAPVAPPGEAALRSEVARVALAQLRALDPAWHPEQRDCAGLVRFAYRAAYKRVRPSRLQTPLWRDREERPLEFADAETLLQASFRLVGRAVSDQLRSGDLAAFRNESGPGGEPVFHLMIVVRPLDKAHGEARVVYHPGEPGAPVRTGTLRELVTTAPAEWRPSPDNPAFLGFFRFREWS